MLIHKIIYLIKNTRTAYNLYNSGFFDVKFYLQQYPDANGSKLGPFFHFFLHGVREGRSPNNWFNFEHYRQKYQLFQLTNLDILKLILKMYPKRLLPIFKKEYFKEAQGLLSLEYHGIGDHVQSGERFDFIFFVGLTDGESKRYRVFNPIEVLKSKGYKCKAFLFNDYAKIIEYKINAKYIVFFRAPYVKGVDNFINHYRQMKAKIVFDVDDLVFDSEIASKFVYALKYLSSNELSSYYDGIHRYKKLATLVDIITCSTEYLVEHAKKINKNAYYIPNTLNKNQIDLSVVLRKKIDTQQTLGEITIGYFSGTKTHQKDFEECEEAIIHVLQNHKNSRFLLVGHLDLSARWDFLEERLTRVAYVPYLQMLEILSGIDVNVAPLESGNPYCDAKSPLKIFEAGVVGVPTVASITSTYRYSIDHGIDGFLAADFNQWVDCLEKLIASSELRTKIGERARERALRQFGPARLFEMLEKVYDI